MRKLAWGAYLILAAFIASYIAVLGVAATAEVFNRVQWPVFAKDPDTWGLLHGFICVLFPVYFITPFGLAWLVGRRVS